jgi:hypothetical protein
MGRMGTIFRNNISLWDWLLAVLFKEMSITAVTERRAPSQGSS